MYNIEMRKKKSNYKLPYIIADRADDFVFKHVYKQSA